MAAPTSNDNTSSNMDAAQIATLKQLRIQSGALRRYTKELKSYVAELNELKSQLNEMRHNNANSDDEKQNNAQRVQIKQQRQAIEETENVIGDIRPKLVKTWETVDNLFKELDGCNAEDDNDIRLLKDTKTYLVDAESLVNG
mmetsp:Transcript_17443/g.27300  ORF Transcript_17443/g.27300 Transcript_17443/m.27300 type:complete len:142 (+) Transcript_17443:2178-2603(+)